MTDISLIIPYPKNAKQHPEAQVERIAKSIQAFGFNQPLVIDKNNVVVVGHGRLEAAKRLGLKEVPTIQVDLTEEQAKAYRLADNKLNESDWDMQLVIEELKGLSAEMLDLTGFDADLIIEEDDKDDAVPETPQKAKADYGEVYELGAHRLMCGDATNLEDVKQLMGGVKADMVFTDPPYNVDYEGRGKETSNKILNDKMSAEEFEEFLRKVFESYKAAVKSSAPFYICHSSSSQIAFERAMTAVELKVKNQIIWNKTVASMGWGDYRWKHEPIFYATFKGKDTQFYGDRTQYTVWNESWNLKRIEKHLKGIAEKQEKGGSTIWTMSREGNYKHPTQKPVELVRLALGNSSKAEDIVLDLFGGSGSTLIACEKMERTCYTMELDPKYVDVIIERWEQFSGNKAKKL